MLIVGPGAALAITSMTNLALTAAAAQQPGIASGVLNSLRQTAGAIGVAALGSISIGGSSLAGIRTAALIVAILHLITAAGFISTINRDKPTLET